MKFTKKNLALLLEAGATRQELLVAFGITLKAFLVQIHDVWGIRSYDELVKQFQPHLPTADIERFVIISGDGIGLIYRGAMCRDSVSYNIRGIFGNAYHGGKAIEGIYAAVRADGTVDVPIISDRPTVSESVTTVHYGISNVQDLESNVYDIAMVPTHVVKMLMFL